MQTDPQLVSVTDSGRRWGPFALAACLLLLGAAVHLLYLLRDCPLDLTGDEAHYWEWSRRPALSYYSKGPLVAYIIAASRMLLAGASERLLGNEVLAVRVPAMLLSVCTGLGVYVLAEGTLRRPRRAIAAVALTFTMPVMAVGSLLMTIDAPLACLYVWTLVLCLRGLRTRHAWPWLVAGGLVALGILAKYTMVLIFPTVLLAAVLEPGFRAALRRPAPYLGGLVSLAGFVPILVWNAQHNWVSVRHVAGQAGVAGGPSFDWLGPLGFLGGQLGVVSPVWFPLMVAAAWIAWRRPEPLSHERHDASGLRFLLAATVIPWLVFLGFSPLTKIQPNWPVLAILPGVILLVWALARWLASPSAATRRGVRGLTATGVVLGLLAVLVLHRTESIMPALAWLARNEPPWNPTPVGRYDPTTRLRGWSQLGQAVGDVLRREQAEGRDPFIITDHYQTASQIAFYCPGRPDVYCLQAVLGDRQSQYDIWPNPIRHPERFIGRPCIYVGSRRPELFGDRPYSHTALPDARIAQEVVHRIRGHAVRLWTVYVCPRYAGLPSELTAPAQRY